MSDLYYESLIYCANRYMVMAEDEELVRFIGTFKQGCLDRLPLMKLNRWLGYIQGTLIAQGFTTVTAERDWTRPLFRPLDFPSNNI